MTVETILKEILLVASMMRLEDNGEQTRAFIALAPLATFGDVRWNENLQSYVFYRYEKTRFICDKNTVVHSVEMIGEGR